MRTKDKKLRKKSGVPVTPIYKLERFITDACKRPLSFTHKRNINLTTQIMAGRKASRAGKTEVEA